MATLVVLAAAEPVEVALDKRAATRVAVDQVLVAMAAAMAKATAAMAKATVILTTTGHRVPETTVKAKARRTATRPQKIRAATIENICSGG